MTVGSPVYGKSVRKMGIGTPSRSVPIPSLRVRGLQPPHHGTKEVGGEGEFAPSERDLLRAVGPRTFEDRALSRAQIIEQNGAPAVRAPGGDEMVVLLQGAASSKNGMDHRKGGGIPSTAVTGREIRQDAGHGGERRIAKDGGMSRKGGSVCPCDGR